MSVVLQEIACVFFSLSNVIDLRAAAKVSLVIFLLPWAFLPRVLHHRHVCAPCSMMLTQGKVMEKYKADHAYESRFLSEVDESSFNSH